MLLLRNNNNNAENETTITTIQYTVQARVEGANVIAPFQPRTATIDANRALNFNLYADGRGYNEFENFNLIAFEIGGSRFERGQSDNRSIFIANGTVFQTNREENRFTQNFTITIIYTFTGVIDGGDAGFF